MKVGSITPPMPYRTDDGKDAMRIIWLKSNTPPHQANLNDDYQKIAAAALNEKKNKALDEWFKKNRGDGLPGGRPSVCRLQTARLSKLT